MTSPRPRGGWRDPRGTAEPVAPQPTYIDPISGQPASVQQNPGQSYPAVATPPGYPAAYPTFGTPDQTYAAGYTGQPGYPTTPGYPAPGYPQQGYPAYPTYPGYPGYTTPVPVGQKTNGLAIASMVVSIAGLTMVACYGLGGLIALVGAILGHVSRRQIRQRGED